MNNVGHLLLESAVSSVEQGRVKPTGASGTVQHQGPSQGCGGTMQLSVYIWPLPLDHLWLILHLRWPQQQAFNLLLPSLKQELSLPLFLKSHHLQLKATARRRSQASLPLPLRALCLAKTRLLAWYHKAAVLLYQDAGSRETQTSC